MFSDNLFNGVISKTMRKFISENIDTTLPFSDCTAGTFAVAGAAAQAGCKKIICSDIGLYSCIVGYYIQGREISDFDIRYDGGDKVLNHAEALFYYWISKLKCITYYDKYIYKNIYADREKYIQNIKRSLDSIKSGFNGVEFMFQYYDLVKAVEEFNLGTMFVDPPASGKNDYIPGEKLTWTKPFEVSQTPFTKLNKLYLNFLESDKKMIIRRFRKVSADEQNYICYSEGKQNKYDYLLSNFITEKKYIDIGKQINFPKKTYHLLTDPSLVNENSNFNLRVIDKNIGLYYRDLFCKGLGQTDAYIFVGWFIDDYILGVSGFHCSDWVVKNQNFIFENFGFSIRLPGLQRLNKLHMMMLTSISLKKIIIDFYKNATLPELTTFRTVCLSKYYEQKGNRGVLKLMSREKMANGIFKLVYETKFSELSLREIYKKWSENNVSKK